MLNLGGLFFTLDADTRGLINAQRRVEQFANQVRGAFRSMEAGNLSPRIANQLARQERQVVSFMERIKRLQNEISQSGFKGDQFAAAQKQLQALTHQYDLFTKKMASGTPLNALDFGRRVQHMRSQLDDTTRSIRNMQREMLGARTPWGNFLGNFHSLGSAALVAQGHFGGLSTRLFAFGNLIQETGLKVALLASLIGGLSVGIGVLATSAVKAGMEMERINVAMEAVTGSAAQAGGQIAYVRDVADQAGLVFADVAKGYTRFLASSKGVLSFKDTQESFRGISLAASKMQLSVEDTQGVFRALDQMMSKGTVQAEELRGQLGDRLPGAFKIAAAAMGVTTRELNEMTKKGEVLAADFVPKFVKTLQQMWNIDPDAQINTLQANLNRLSNEFTYFAQDLDKTTGASRVFGAMVKSLTDVLNELRGVLPEIIKGLGALTGAFTALAAVMAIQALINYVTYLWNLVAVYNTATRAVMLFATAQNILNAALTRLPLGKVITLVAGLALAIGGAIIGYREMEKALEGNNAAMTNLSGIEGYIDAQKRMGFQVRETTQDMYNQIAVMMATSIGEFAQQYSKYEKLKKSLKGLNEESFLTKAGRAISGGPSTIELYKELTNQFNETGAALRRTEADMRRQTKALKGLGDVNKLPDAPMAPGIADATGSGDSDAVKALDDSIGRVDDLIVKMREAEAVLTAIGQSPGDWKIIEDVYEAERAINQFAGDTAKLDALDKALNAVGITGGNTMKELTARMGIVVTRTRQAAEATEAFKGVWEDIIKDSQKVATFQSQIDHLLSGGSVEGLAFFEDLEDAFKTLKDIDPNTTGGIAALKQIRELLQQLGYTVGNTGDDLWDTGKALAEFYNKTSNAGQAVKVFADLSEEIRKTKEELVDMAVLQNAYSASAGGLGQIFSADVGDEARAAIERGRKVNEFRRILQGLGQDQNQVNASLEVYLQQLQALDEASFNLDKVKEAAEANKAAFRGMANEALTGIRDLIKGTKSLTDALLDLASSIVDSLWERFIINPVDNLIQNIGRDAGKGATSGLDRQVGGLSPANDNAAAQVGALGNAAAQAANAVGGNFMSSAVALAAQLITTSTANATAAATTSAKSAADAAAASQTLTNVGALIAFQASVRLATQALIAMATSGEGGGGSGIIGALAKGAQALFSGAEQRALGGSMFPGQLYHINEPGISGEYFIPSVSGHMSNSAPANNNGSVYVDARTTIDARGASREAVAELKREMAQRDANLRRELPYMVDSRVVESRNRGRYNG